MEIDTEYYPYVKMVVDPADSTYMPSLLVISGGDSLSNLQAGLSIHSWKILEFVETIIEYIHNQTEKF